MSSNLLRKILAEAAHAELDAADRITVDDVVSRALREHGGQITAESDRLVREAAAKIVKDILRELAADDEPGAQTAIPGLHLPTAIAVRTVDDDGDASVLYVRSDKARWPELLAGREERQQNVARAVARLKEYDESLDRLRRWMESDPGCTVAEALRREREAGGSA